MEAYGILGDTTNYSAQFDAVEGNTQLDADTRALALYKKGTYLLTAGDKTDATTAFQGVQSKYGTSYLAIRASQQIANMN